MVDKMSYTTPVTVAFERKGHYILTFEKEGYDSKQIELLRSMRGWMLVWDILWFPVGVIVDAITGAWYRLEPDNISVKLNKLSSTGPGPSQINIMLSTLGPVASIRAVSRLRFFSFSFVSFFRLFSRSLSNSLKRFFSLSRRTFSCSRRWSRSG